MNKLRMMTLLLAGTLALGGMAQDAGKEKRKQVKKELKEKASKSARKEAKKLTKQGWTVSPGGLPLEKQLDRSYMFELETDDDLNPVYVMGEGQSIGENYDAAKLQAMELARQQMAGKIGSEVTALVDNLVANKQLEAGQAASITTTMSEGKTIYSQKLGRVQPVVECYRTLENKNKEVLVRLVTKESAIQEIARGAIRDELERRGIAMSEELKSYLSGK